MLTIIQFDCAATPLIEELLAAGRLPVLAELRERGTWQPLDTPAEHFPAGTYHTLYSGVPLGAHGQHYAFQWDAAKQRLRYRTKFENPMTVWDRAAAVGRRAVVIDPYEGCPPQVKGATVVSGWQFENVISMERWSSPSSAGRELNRLFGRGPTIQEVFGPPSRRLLLAARSVLLAAPARAADAATHLIAREQPDLAWVAMMSAHLGGHLFWDLSQIDAGLDDGTRRVLSGTLMEIYEACDAAIGRIVRGLPEGADVMLVSPMGIGPEASRVDVLPGMLNAVLSGRPAEVGGGGLLWRIRDAVPTDARAVAARVTGRRLTQELTCRISTLGTDWSRTRAFMVASDHHGQIRFNVRGRDREGIVDPADVDALASEITEGLLSFREGDGTRSVAEVWRTRDVIDAGAPAFDMLPDLVVRFAQSPMAANGTSSSPRFGEVRRHGMGTGRTGGHTSDAWVLLAPGSARLRGIDRPHVLDISATAYELLGLASGEFGGQPLLERASAAARAAA